MLDIVVKMIICTPCKKQMQLVTQRIQNEH